MTTTQSQRSRRDIPTQAIGLVAAVIAFAIPFVFEFNGLSTAGHRMFAIFLVAIVLWVTEAIPLYATAVLIIMLEILMISDQALVGASQRF